MTKSKYLSQTDVKTVRISPETHAALKALALEWSMPIGQVVGQLAQFAIEGELRPQITLKQANNKGGHRAAFFVACSIVDYATMSIFQDFSQQGRGPGYDSAPARIV